MGFNDLKKTLISCLKSGHWEIEDRANINEKNLLYTGAVTAEEVIEMVKCCTGDCHTKSKLSRTISGQTPDVHILKPLGDYKGWYIKFYFIDPNAIIVSVHESDKK